MVEDIDICSTAIPTKPKLALRNFITDPDQLKRFAIERGFDGIGWIFDLEHLPRESAEDSRWVQYLSVLKPLPFGLLNNSVT